MAKWKVYPYLAVPEKSHKRVKKRLQEYNLLVEDRKVQTAEKRVFFPLTKMIDPSIIFPKTQTKEYTIGTRKFALISTAPERKKARRRTLIQRAKEIFEHIEKQTEPFPKSDFNDAIGLNPEAADKWLNLIDYIQSQPRIRVTKMGSSTYVEKIENRHLSMLRKRILDSSLSLKEREATIDDYISVLSTLERAETMRIKR